MLHAQTHTQGAPEWGLFVCLCVCRCACVNVCVYVCMCVHYLSMYTDIDTYTYIQTTHQYLMSVFGAVEWAQFFKQLQA